MNSSKRQKRNQTQKQRQKQNKSKKTKGGYISNKKTNRTMVTKPATKSATKRSIKTYIHSKKHPPSPVSNALLLPKIMNTF